MFWTGYWYLKHRLFPSKWCCYQDEQHFSSIYCLFSATVWLGMQSVPNIDFHLMSFLTVTYMIARVSSNDDKLSELVPILELAEVETKFVRQLDPSNRMPDMLRFVWPTWMTWIWSVVMVNTHAHLNNPMFRTIDQLQKVRTYLVQW